MEIIITDEKQKELLSKVDQLKEYLESLPFDKTNAAMLSYLGEISRTLTGENN